VCIPRRRIAAHSGTWTAKNNNNNNIAEPKGGGGGVKGGHVKVVPIGKLLEFFKFPPTPSPLFFLFFFFLILHFFLVLFFLIKLLLSF